MPVASFYPVWELNGFSDIVQCPLKRVREKSCPSWKTLPEDNTRDLLLLAYALEDGTQQPMSGGILSGPF